jgi:Na+/H+-dicarboxylate symporter
MAAATRSAQGAKERWVGTGSIVALGLGLVLGEVLHQGMVSAAREGGGWGTHVPAILENLSVVGDLVLVRPLMLLVLPIIFTSVCSGVTALGDPARLGRLGAATAGYFMVTMLVAAIIGAVLVTAIAPGTGLSEDTVTALKNVGIEQFQASTQAHAATTSAASGGLGAAWLSIIRQVLPGNPFAAMAQGQPLGMIVFALVLGVGIAVGGPATAAAGRTIEALNEALLRAVGWVLWVIPVGALCLVTASVGHIGLAALVGPLGLYMAAVVGGLAIHMFVVLPALLAALGGGNPFRFMYQVREALATAFATASSSATLPVTMRVCETEGGCSRRATRFCAPLGGTLNMDGTALYEAVAVVFLFQLYGVDLSLGELVTVIVTATLAAVGAAGIPSAGLVTMVIVITAVNASLGSERLPVGAMGIVIGVDRLLDMCRTTVNVWGDMSAARVMTRLAPDD